MNENQYAAQNSDTALSLLQQIFGSALDHVSPGLAPVAADNLLGAMFGWFNSGVLFLGAIILFWVTVFGIANTANDGQTLGKKWSTFYTPLRTLAASALLIPSAAGYSGVQWLILKIVVWSIGFASAGWSTYVSHALVDDVVTQAVKSVTQDGAFDELAAAAVRMRVCVYATNKGVTAALGPNAQQLGLAIAPTKEVQVGDAIEQTSTIYAIAPNWPSSRDLCGQAQITTRFIASSSNSLATRHMAGDAGTVADALAVVRYKTMSDLFLGQDIQPIANKIIMAAESGSPIDTASVKQDIIQLRERMVSTMRATVRDKVSADNSALLHKFEDKGWMWAGALHMEVGKIKDAVRNASKMRAEFQPGSPSHLVLAGDVGNAVESVALPYTNVAALALQRAAGTPESTTKPLLPAIQSSFTLDDFADGGTGVKSTVSRWFKSLGDNAVRTVVYSLDTTGTKDVLWQVKDLGDNLAVYAESALVAKSMLIGGLEGVTELAKTAATQSMLGTNVSVLGAFGVGVVAGIKGFAVDVFSTLSHGIYLLLYAGYFLGIWIPMIPYYVFTLGVAGWIIVVAESMIASALWMMMHLTPDTEGSFIGSQRQGYMLVASVFLRPALMLFGLILSFVLITPIVAFVNESFMTLFRSLQADSTTGILSVAGYILAYCVVIFGVFMMVFTLCQTLPDRILRWIGGGVGDLGEQNALGRVESVGSGQARGALVVGSRAAKDGSGRGADAVNARKAQTPQEITGDANVPMT